MGVEAGGATEEVAGPAEGGAGGFAVLEDVAPGFAGGESGVCPGGAGLAGEGSGVEGVAEDGEVEGLEVGGLGGWAVSFFVEGFEAAVWLAVTPTPPPITKPCTAQTMGTGSCQARCRPMCRSAVQRRTMAGSLSRSG